MLPSSTKPVCVFVSYSHKDERFRQELHEALAPLRRRGLIKDWFDGKIVPGTSFDREIAGRLRRSDIVILLLSPSYVASDYCWDKEQEVAFELRRNGATRVVGIVVRPVHLDETELSRHKLLPRDRKAVQLWRPKALGWENVCAGIEQVIQDLRSRSQVDEAIDAAKLMAATAEAAAASFVPSSREESKELAGVGDFWDAGAVAARPGTTVTIEGTFSQFAPMLVGPPRVKSVLHKTFRQALERDDRLRRQKGSVVDSCLSISAGQMVCNLDGSSAPFRHFGLYNSIVRNSILVLVTPDYVRSRLEPAVDGMGRRTFEARVHGRVIPLDNAPARRFLHRYARPFVSKKLVDDLCRDVRGLVVDGHGTDVEVLGPPRYLDGDIWIAIESEGKERFLTSFVNVADPDERRREMEGLLAAARLLPGPPRIIAHYDAQREFMRDPTLVRGSNRFLDSIWRTGSGGDETPSAS